ncbi:MAG: hypothetical protein MR368_04040 [Azospirillum sp.]|nr:hypothetical protein [Azospirillum sp.]
MKKLAKQKNIRYSALALYGNYSATGIYEGSIRRDFIRFASQSTVN